MGETKREYRIDLMRAFACIMVLFCHSPRPNIGQPGKFLVGITNYYGMALGPILFFMISGACILWEEKDAKPFLKKKVFQNTDTDIILEYSIYLRSVFCLGYCA